MKKHFCGILVVEKEHAVVRGFVGLCLLIMVVANTNAALGAIITNITATASSAEEAMGPEKTIDGSGLNASGEHSTVEYDMWLSLRNVDDPNPWIQYEFDRIYNLNEMHVWNSNQVAEPALKFGAKNVTIETSTDGVDWTPLMTTQFNMAPGLPDYMYNTTVVLGGVSAKLVKLNINDKWGFTQFPTGLSEVQFFDDAPVVVNEPPVADAGLDQELYSGSDGEGSVTLNGSGSTDPDSTADTNDDIASFTWSEDGAHLGTGETLQHSFERGIHTVTLTVEDGEGETDTDTVLITVLNNPPVADAGADQEVISSNGVDAVVTLNGSGSDVEGDSLTYTWTDGDTIVSGETVEMTLPVGDNTIILTVSDGTDEGTDEIVVTVISASRAAENLSDLLNELEPPLPTETVSALATSLEAAIKSFDKGNTGAGVNQLRAFQNKVNAQRGKKIDAETAAEIISLAQDIIDAAAG